MGISGSKPLITTVVPTYRRPTLLRRAIASILAQTYPHFRVCVYDNASGDETVAVCEEFREKDSRVEFICRPNNIGAHANFMDGANRVETPFFSFLSDDDFMLPNLYEDALAGFLRYPEAALSTLATLQMSPTGKFLSSPILRWPVGLVEPPNGVLSIVDYGDPGLQALLIRKEVWERFGGFDELTEPSGDVDFQMRVGAYLPIVVSREVGAIGIMHDDCTTARTEIDGVWCGWRRLVEKFSQDTNLLPAVRRRATAVLTRRMKRSLVTKGVMRYISCGKWDKAEWAADMLVVESGQARAARIIRGATAICRRLPGIPVLVRALFALRAGEKALRNLGAQWRVRSYTKLVRDAPVAPPQPQVQSTQTPALHGFARWERRIPPSA